MLRELLGQPPRRMGGLLAGAMDRMAEMAALLRREMEEREDRDHVFRKLDVWTRGLMVSLDELEETLFAATFYRNKVRSGYMDEMSPAERADYARYVYFYKNGFIRVFSLLDKLGTVLNALYDLNTSKVKSHFSYFTVLRQLQTVKEHDELLRRLNAIKDRYRDPLHHLRKRRNAEVHYMNSEMVDDLWQRHQGLHDRLRLEDLDGHLQDLRQGLEMVCDTIHTAYGYTLKRWKK